MQSASTRRSLASSLQALAVAALGLWLVSGLYVVRANEQGVIRTLGRVTNANVKPGIHWRPPYPLTRLAKVRPREQKRISIGTAPVDAAVGRQAEAKRLEFFTGDQNLINIEMMVQYVIADAKAYLFRSGDAQAVIACVAARALSLSVAGQGVDFVLTTGRPEVERQVLAQTQWILDRYGVGVALTAVSIQRVDPPAEVAGAFKDVASAREDKARLVNEAYGYANESIPKARGEAQKLVSDAQAYREKRINESTGEADRFKKAYAEYRKARDATSARLYVEAMEQILPKLKKVVVDSKGGKSPIDLGVIQSAE